jgi:hypothetical protein
VISKLGERFSMLDVNDTEHGLLNQYILLGHAIYIIIKTNIVDQLTVTVRQIKHTKSIDT